MKLSEGEKLILYMLSELYRKPIVNREIDPDFVQGAIVSGNLWGLKWKYGGLFPAEDTPAEVVDEVVNVLDMWLILEEQYGKLSKPDQARVDAVHPGGCRYPGFDGNHETEHRGVVRFLTKHLERFPSFKDRADLDSHFPTLATHRAMYRRFEPMRKRSLKPGLSADDLIEILGARV